MLNNNQLTFEISNMYVLSVTDKVCRWLVACWWFSPITPVSSTNKTDRHYITEILLKVALSTITLTLKRYSSELLLLFTKTRQIITKLKYIKKNPHLLNILNHIVHMPKLCKFTQQLEINRLKFYFQLDINLAEYGSISRINCILTIVRCNYHGNLILPRL
jgi:hypothetical protein